tara:strand:- start:3315 stop:4370 length:1056 start_codon:yes stop_codon:yes gene_type:complete
MAYTSINDPSAQFQTQLYTGTSATHSVTFGGNSNLQPDWVWTKCRSNTSNHFLFDSTRGVTKQIHSDTTDPEGTNATGLTSFNSDGWTMGNTGGMNFSSQTYVGWGWKANGATTASNGSGSITSTTQANTTAGFSIVTYTGNGVNGATVGHSLSAIPQMIIVKRLDSAANWMVYHQAMGPTKAMFLDLTAASDTDASYWSNTAPTTGIFNLGTNTKGNANGGTYVAYCFSNTKGYSSFGSYMGNGGSNGPFVFLGFKPAFVMIKKVNSAEDWGMVDDKRSSTNGFNVIDRFLYANQNYAEATTQTPVDLLSNGFKGRNTDGKWNTDGSQYIYMAFASSPFVSSAGVPTTAR